jgi:hypothetical protein
VVDALKVQTRRGYAEARPGLRHNSQTVGTEKKPSKGRELNRVVAPNR